MVFPNPAPLESLSYYLQDFNYPFAFFDVSWSNGKAPKKRRLFHGTIHKWTVKILLGNSLKLLGMAIEIVSCPIKNGGSIHSYVNVYQRVVDVLQVLTVLHQRSPCDGSQVWYPQWQHPRRLKPTLPPGSLMKCGQMFTSFSRWQNFREIHQLCIPYMIR